jgi:hypothetical protein
METPNKKMKLIEYSSFDVYIQNYEVSHELKTILEKVYYNDPNITTLDLCSKFQEILTL